MTSERQKKFDEAGREDTQGLIRKDLLLDDEDQEIRCSFNDVDGNRCEFRTSDNLEYLKHREIHEKVLMERLVKAVHNDKSHTKELSS